MTFNNRRSVAPFTGITLSIFYFVLKIILGSSAALDLFFLACILDLQNNCFSQGNKF